MDSTQKAHSPVYCQQRRLFGEPILVYYDKGYHPVCAYCHMRTFGFVYNGNKDGVNVSICWPCTQKK